MPGASAKQLPSRQRFRIFSSGVLAWILLSAWLPAQIVAFDADRWDLSSAQVQEHLGRPALQGNAFLKDGEFENGVIEVDLAVSGGRSYPGIVFRSQPGGNWERIYLRPHRAPLYDDVIQYVPAFGGADSWQLYHGPGFTAGAEIPAGRWIHLKLEVSGRQARLFLDGADRPALEIFDLKHGVSKGGLGLMGPRDGSAWFADFTWRSDDRLAFDPPPFADEPPGVIREWELSEPLPAAGLDTERPPDAAWLAGCKWQEVIAEPSGLVDVARFVPRGPVPACVYARATVRADAASRRKLRFGYSDIVSVFLNGEPLFAGNSVYRSRDGSFLGIVGLQDAVWLPLRAGDNELLLAVTEVMGGWGFLAQDGTAVYRAAGVAPLWETPAAFRMPESAAWDPARKVLYVSNYDGFHPGGAEPAQSIARVSADGQVLAADWIAGLRNPTGLAVAGDRLWAVERTGLVEIDIPAGAVAARHPLPGAGMLNDVAVAPDGAVFVSDSARAAVYRFAGGQWEPWLQGEAIARPNGLLVQGGRLLVAVNGDGCLKSVDLTTKAVTVVARFGPGLLDGLQAEPDGSLLVSHNEGRLFRVSPAGEITKVLDLSVIEVPIADFAYDPAGRRVVFPTWLDNRVMAYRLGGTSE
jgi:sugar lactone lactonase YvrE